MYRYAQQHFAVPQAEALDAGTGYDNLPGTTRTSSGQCIREPGSGSWRCFINPQIDMRIIEVAIFMRVAEQPFHEACTRHVQLDLSPFAGMGPKAGLPMTKPNRFTQVNVLVLDELTLVEDTPTTRHSQG